VAILIDNSILARLCRADDPQHTSSVDAIRILTEQGEDLIISPQCLREFFAVATREREANGLDMTPREAHEQMERFRASFTFLPEIAGIFGEWLKLIRDFDVKGKAIHDANHVAFMLTHGVGKVLTLDAGFERYDGKVIQMLTTDSVIKQRQK
jgi:predicted nucleic acid-binding protein